MSRFKRSFFSIAKFFFNKNILVSKQFVEGYDLPQRYRRPSCKHIALRTFSRSPKNPHRPSVPHEICVGNPGYQVLVYCTELAGGLGDIQAQGTDLRDLYHKPFSLSMACFNL